jgi:hypothetical protein
MVGPLTCSLTRLKKSQECPKSQQERPKSEIEMSRITLICFFAASLAACGTESPAQTALAQERLACANVGIDPDSLAFGQCVGDLAQSLRDDERR